MLYEVITNAMPPRNLHADDAVNAYEIDRTSEDDDDKEWNPANELPEDWADYDCVKLTVEYLRYDSSRITSYNVCYTKLLRPKY